MELSPPYNRALHRMALLTAWATFPLIFIGGLVTSKDAGLSVPDWPNSYGYNMFLFPPRLWVGNIFYEHTHRLVASAVGFLTICLVATALWTERRAWVKWLTAACLSVVIFQGVLGGLRVVLLKLDLAIVHACIAQAFFCLLMLVCVVTSRWWQAAAPQRDAQSVPGRRFVKIAVAAVVVVYLQLIVGATMRHYRAGLAIPDLPLAYGQILPPTNQPALDAAQDAAANDRWQAIRTDYFSVTQVWLAMGHRIGAVLVSIATLTLAIAALRRRAGRGIDRPAILLIALLLAQLTLGVLTVLKLKPADVASAHVACGALVLVTAFVIAVRGMRLYWADRVTTGERRGFEVGVESQGPRAGRLNGAVG